MTTTSPLVARLAALPATVIDRSGGATAAAITAVETQNRLALPDDLRDVLRFSDGFEIYGGGTSFALYNAADLTWTSSEPHFREGLPGMLLLGTDGEGGVFFADPRDALGRGAFAVYHVPMSTMSLANAVFVGASFTVAVEALLAGTNVYEATP